MSDTTADHVGNRTTYEYEGITYLLDYLYADNESDAWTFTQALACGMPQMAVYETLCDDPDRAVHYSLAYVVGKWGPLRRITEDMVMTDPELCRTCGHRHHVRED